MFTAFIQQVLCGKDSNFDLLRNLLQHKKNYNGKINSNWS